MIHPVLAVLRESNTRPLRASFARPTPSMARRPTCVLPPIATTGGLGQLTRALGLALGRRSLRHPRVRRGRWVQKLRCNLRRGPNDLGEEVSIFGATGVGVDALHQRLRLFGTQRHVLEVFEQREASKHGRPPPAARSSPGIEIQTSGLADQCKEVKLAGRKETEGFHILFP